MTLLEYFNNLRDLIEKNPKYKDLQVCCSSDDEGNSYQIVNFYPSPAYFENVTDYNLDLIGVLGEVGIKKENINAIIIN